MIRRVVLAWLAAFALGLASAACADELQPSPPIAAALERAGANRGEIENALSRCPSTQRQAMAFLVENMPDRDLRELTAEFLLDNCRLAAEARDAAPWGKSLPEEIYLNEVLPYGVISERREPWRHDLRARFLPAVQGATRPAQAAAILNQKVFAELGVRYSTDRPKADQSPLESIEAKKATCTGLSVLLIAACRAVGVPARFAGTPLWADQSGNHSWVEVDAFYRSNVTTRFANAPGATDSEESLVRRENFHTQNVTREAATSVAFRTWVGSKIDSRDTTPRYVVTASGDTSWGPGNAATDVTLKRSAAGILQASGKLTAVGGLGVGNSAAASTPGTVVKKIQVFDANGTSLGYIPVYNNIT